jgi:sporulation-control protein spo0M
LSGGVEVAEDVSDKISMEVSRVDGAVPGGTLNGELRIRAGGQALVFDKLLVTLYETSHYLGGSSTGLERQQEDKAVSTQKLPGMTVEPQQEVAIPFAVPVPESTSPSGKMAFFGATHEVWAGIKMGDETLARGHQEVAILSPRELTQVDETAEAFVEGSGGAIRLTAPRAARPGDTLTGTVEVFARADAAWKIKHVRVTLHQWLGKFDGDKVGGDWYNAEKIDGVQLAPGQTASFPFRLAIPADVKSPSCGPRSGRRWVLAAAAEGGMLGHSTTLWLPFNLYNAP